MGAINGRVIYSPKGKAGYDTITEHWEGRPEQPRIYWKDSIVNPLGIDRGELPGYCVPVNWDLFNNEK